MHSSLQIFLALVVVFIGALISGPIALAADGLQAAPMIFDVRINLPLEPDDATYHDFYINAGPEAGFKRGQYIMVVRPVPVHDPVQNKQQATLNIGVARLLVIHTEHGITVARLNSEFTDEDRPTLEYESVMIGDRIDVSMTTMDAPNAKKKSRPAVSAKPRPSARLEAAERTEESAKADIPAAAPAPSSSSPQSPVQIPVPQPPAQGPNPTGPLGPTRSTSSAGATPLLAVGGWDVY
jgi:hypothetical protein